MDTHESLCSLCAKQGKTCCQEAQIFVTLGDVERMTFFAGEERFWEYARPAKEYYGADAECDPLWARIFLSDGSRRVIRHAPEGGCRFLTASGCRLPVSARPLVCLLYPFDYNHIAIKGINGHLCPESDNGPLLLAMLGMSRIEAEEWRRRLYREIVAEFPG